MKSPFSSSFSAQQLGRFIQMERTSVPSDATETSAQNQAAERRIATRHPCNGFAEVAVPCTGFLFRGEIGNLSEFGCYIKTRAHLNVSRSTEVEIRFTVSSNNFSVLARCAAVQSGVGGGFEFTLIEPRMHKKLLELIEELNARDASSEPA